MKDYKLNQPGNNYCYFYLAKSKEPCWGDVTLSNTEYNSDWGESEDIFECEGHKGCFDSINFYKENVEN